MSIDRADEQEAPLAICLDKLAITSLEDSNLFLRALWASLRARFGKLGWQLTPRRDGPQRKIRFGWMTLGAVSPDGVGVSVFYKQKGVINAIEFQPRGNISNIHPRLPEELRECVEDATNRMANCNQISYSVQVAAFPAFTVGYYRGDDWYIGPLDNGHSEIGITVRAFDEPDGEHEFASRLPVLLDILACMTNCAFERVSNVDGECLASDTSLNSYFASFDWLDAFPVGDGHLRLTTNQVEYISRLLGRPAEENRITRAARMFHKALTLFRRVPECQDVSLALFVSALEAVDLPPNLPAVCPECNQEIYKISKRVVDLGVRHLGLGVERIFKENYQLRSMYLHKGAVRSTRPIGSHFVPLLDPNGVEGCAMPAVSSGPHNLMEFTSFVIRAEILEGKPGDVSTAENLPAKLD